MTVKTKPRRSREAGRGDSGRPAGTKERAAARADRDRLLARQQAVFDTMTPALRALAKQIRDRLDRLDRHNLREAWEVGRDIAVAYDDSTGKYGPDPVGKLEAVLGHSRDHILKKFHFYKDFSKEMLDWLMSQRMSGSLRPLNWNHVLQLLPLTTDAERKKFVEMAVKDDLTPTELADVIQRRTKAGRDRRGGGRPLRVPPRLEGKLTNVGDTLRKVSRIHKELWVSDTHGILATVTDAPADKITPDIVAQIDADLALAMSVTNNMQALIAALSQARAVAQAKIQAQAKLQADEEVQAVNAEFCAAD